MRIHCMDIGTDTRSDSGGISRQEIEQLIEQEIAPLKKEIDEIKAMLRALQRISKIEQNTEAILEDTDSIRRNVEPTDERF